MTDRFFSVNLPDGRAVCISPLADATYYATEARDLGDADGYFIYEYKRAVPHAGIEVLAKAASYDAAMRLAEIYLQAARRAS